MIDRKIIQKFREMSHRTLNILDEIERGERSASEIAKTCRCSRQLADHYLTMVVKEKD